MEGELKEETLPPGFRFHPSDEELITYYLMNKISDNNFTGKAIGDVDLNKCEPWDLPAKAKMGEKEWYFFSRRDRKYPTGVRTNRATNTGYWKTTGKDKDIYNSTTVTSELVGMKKTLVFYKGRAPRGEKSNWVMHEYRIHSKSVFRTPKDEWVVCRVFQKTAGVKKYPSHNHFRAMNHHSYLEIGPSAMPPQIMMGDDTFQFPVGSRNYISNPAELSRAASSTNINLPIQYQLNYPIGGHAGWSGLNLNLVRSASTHQIFHQAPPPPHPRAMNQHDVLSNMIMSTSTALANEAVAAGNYGGADMNHANIGTGNRFMNMDQCSDLDNYWPPY